MTTTITKINKKRNKIKDNFKLYSDMKVNDYVLKLGDNFTNTALLIPGEYFSDFKKDGDSNIVPRKFIKNLHPDYINTNKFWKESVDRFPFFSIAGGSRILSTIEEVNAATLQMHYHLGCLNVLNEYLVSPNEDFLEIGPGYGNIQQYIEYYKFDNIYHAIDVNPLFSHPRIKITDGKTIPNDFPEKFGMVYSVNVFQHLSKKQRTSYYNQIYNRLNDGGLFVFGMFVITNENKDWKTWGVKDEHGRFYTQFFNQLTEIDHIDELTDELNSIGFEVERISKIEDQFNYLSFKCTK